MWHNIYERFYFIRCNIDIGLGSPVSFSGFLKSLVIFSNNGNWPSAANNSYRKFGLTGNKMAEKPLHPPINIVQTAKLFRKHLAIKICQEPIHHVPIPRIMHPPSLFYIPNLMFVFLRYFSRSYNSLCNSVPFFGRTDLTHLICEITWTKFNR